MEDAYATRCTSAAILICAAFPANPVAAQDEPPEGWELVQITDEDILFPQEDAALDAELNISPRMSVALGSDSVAGFFFPVGHDVQVDLYTLGSLTFSTHGLIGSGGTLFDLPLPPGYTFTGSRDLMSTTARPLPQFLRGTSPLSPLIPITNLRNRSGGAPTEISLSSFRHSTGHTIQIRSLTWSITQLTSAVIGRLLPTLT